MQAIVVADVTKFAGDVKKELDIKRVANWHFIISLAIDRVTSYHLCPLVGNAGRLQLIFGYVRYDWDRRVRYREVGHFQEV